MILNDGVNLNRDSEIKTRLTWLKKFREKKEWNSLWSITTVVLETEGIWSSHSLFKNNRYVG